MNTYTIEVFPYPADDTAARLVRHQCVDYAEATLAFDATLAETARTGGSVELVQHGPDDSVKVKGVYRRRREP